MKITHLITSGVTATLLAGAILSAHAVSTGSIGMATPPEAARTTSTIDGRFPLSSSPIALAVVDPISFGAVCDGVNDDTAAIQAALNFATGATATSRNVVIPSTAGGCVISGPLFVNSNTHVTQDGLLFLKRVTTSPQPQWGMYTLVNGAQNITIEGNGVLDGNRAAATPLPTQQNPNICCIGGIVSGGPGVGVYTTGPTNVKIRGLTIKNIPQWPVSIDGATTLVIESVTAFDSTNSFQIGHGTKDATVSDVHIRDISDVCFAFYRGVHNGSIVNSTVDKCGGAGISVITDSPAGVPAGQASSEITITGNTASNSNGGIDVNGMAAGVPISTNVIISGNHVHHNRTLGIGLTPCNQCQVTGNIIHDDGIAAVGNVAGVVIVTSTGGLVSGNKIYNEGQGTVTGNGIVISDWAPFFPASSKITISNNEIYDYQSTKTMYHGLFGGTVNPVVSIGNVLGATLSTRDGMAYAAGSVQSNISAP